MTARPNVSEAELKKMSEENLASLRMARDWLPQALLSARLPLALAKSSALPRQRIFNVELQQSLNVDFGPIGTPISILFTAQGRKEILEEWRFEVRTFLRLSPQFS